MPVSCCTRSWTLVPSSYTLQILSNISCDLLFVVDHVHLFHLTIANFLLSIHGFSTNDCRGSGPRRTCLSSSTVSRGLSFTSIWGLHSYPSCGTPEVSILTFKRIPAFDVLLIRMAASRSTSKVGLRLSPLPLLTSMRKCGPYYRRGPGQPLSSSLARRVRVQPLLLFLLLFFVR